jgi:hypothetical protein
VSVENVNIAKSVGRGGVNVEEDVRKIQTLLNEQMPVPLRPLEVNGKCGTETIIAIEEFQRRVLKQARPDGKVDPQGKTMAALSPVALERSPEVLVPYLQDHGLYVKTSGSKNLFATPGALASLKTAARKLKEQYDANLGIVELSKEAGGNLPPHKSHRRGIDADIRPLRKDKKNLPVSMTELQYSRDLTRALVGYLLEDPNVSLILFADKQIDGITYDKHHHDHLHVRFKE